jgi:hypothetical protein
MLSQNEVFSTDRFKAVGIINPPPHSPAPAEETKDQDKHDTVVKEIFSSMLADDLFSSTSQNTEHNFMEKLAKATKVFETGIRLEQAKAQNRIPKNLLYTGYSHYMIEQRLGDQEFMTKATARALQFAAETLDHILEGYRQEYNTLVQALQRCIVDELLPSLKQRAETLYGQVDAYTPHRRERAICKYALLLSTRLEAYHNGAVVNFCKKNDETQRRKDQLDELKLDIVKNPTPVVKELIASAMKEHMAKTEKTLNSFRALIINKPHHRGRSMTSMPNKLSATPTTSSTSANSNSSSSSSSSSNSMNHSTGTPVHGRRGHGNTPLRGRSNKRGRGNAYRHATAPYADSDQNTGNGRYTRKAHGNFGNGAPATIGSNSSKRQRKTSTDNVTLMPSNHSQKRARTENTSPAPEAMQGKGPKAIS